ncbi:MAG: dockerin type I repeat-containing protein [Saccharofermentanales bacterium]
MGNRVVKMTIIFLLMLSMMAASFEVFSVRGASAADTSAVIYSVSPAAVDVAGNVAGILTGVGFTEEMILFIGDIQTEYTYANDKRLDFTIPAGNIGRVDAVLKTMVGETAETAAALANAITYQDATAEMQLSGGEIQAEKSVRLPISITAAGDLFGMDLELALDGLLFTSIAFEKSDTAPDAIASFSVFGDRVLASIASPVALPKDEPIGYLVLTADEVAGTTPATIHIMNCALNGVTISSLVDATLSILPNFTVSGRITYYSNGAGIGQAVVRLSNGTLAVADPEGYYEITGITEGSLIVSASLKGNVNQAVTAQDASLVLQSVVEQISLSENQVLAADVDGNGAINAMDAVYILQKSVGIIQGDYPGTLAEWKFTPSFHPLTLVSDTGDVNFTAILLGDVSGSWTAVPVGEIS